MALIQSTAIPSGATDYELEQSLKFNDDDSGYLSWTAGTATNRKIWTYSCWVKRCELGTGESNRSILFEAISPAGASSVLIFFFNDDKLQLYEIKAGAPDYGVITSSVFRDTSAWYHVILAVDSTQSTDTNRIKLYVNGVNEPLTDLNGLFPLNYESNVNDAIQHNIGKYTDISVHADLYLSEVNFIDGQALTPADLGETGTYGEWKPIEYSGTYGNNGFYLPFKQDYTVEGFSTVTYKGNNANQYIGGTGFSPDLTWIKERNGTRSHVIYDQVRGLYEDIRPNTTAAEGTGESGKDFTAFNSDGFTLGVGYTETTNRSGYNYVAWNWDMGGSNATNTNGSITSTVRANTTYGQSIVSFTGTGSSATVGHGLSSKPDVVLTKRRDSTSHWLINDWSGDYANKLKLNDTEASSSSDNFVNDASATTFTLGTDTDVNANNGTYIAYCWHSVAGYSKFGTYTGNATSGNTITTGFPVAWVMIKRRDGINNWSIIDNTRTPTGVSGKALLRADESVVEQSGAETEVELTTTGFKINNTQGELNGSGRNYIYAAFADKREYAYWLDQSGNNNDWTSNNLTESDISVDSPTNNFATFNTLDPQGTTSITFSEGNLKVVQAASWTGAVNNVLMTSGKWYWEYSGTDMSNSGVGVIKPNGGQHLAMNVANNGYFGKADRGYGINFQHGNAGDFYTNVTKTTDDYLSAYSNGDVIAVAYDADTGKIWIAKNNTWGTTSGGLGNPSTGANPAATVANPEEGYLAGFALENCTIVANFGQDSSFAGNKTAQGNQDGNDIGDFYYTPPTGFLALCTKNLPDVAVTPSEHFNTVLYTGTGSSNAISVGFQPDLVWLKMRTQAYDHNVYDSVRGATKYLYTNATDAQATNSERLKTFDSNGFTVGTQHAVNENTYPFVAWNWKANGSGSSNTNGSINSTVSANVDAGFSIVNWTKEGSSGTKTVGHGLSKAPEIIIFKEVDDPSHWSTYVGVGGSTTRGLLYLNLNDAQTTNDANQWSDTAPTSTVFTYNQSYTFGANNTAEMIGYAFHSVDGYSKMGSYTGNGSTDGTFVYTGFKPMMVIYKRSSASEDWYIRDTARDPTNPGGNALSPNSTGTTSNNCGSSGNTCIDYLSNGFKLRGTDTQSNDNGSTYIYIAFASVPFKFSNAR